MIQAVIQKKVNIVKIRFILSCVILSGMLVTDTIAGNFQSHAEINNTVRQFMLKHVLSTYQQRPEITTGKLDPRLKLTQCSRPLDAYLPSGGRDIGKVTVKVRCADSRPWSLHVPAIVSLHKNVMVAARPLSRGTLLTKSDVKLAKWDLARLTQGYIENLDHGLGMELKRNIAAGRPLTPASIKKPQIIKRGQRVSIIVRSGRMEVRMAGEALAQGAAGDRIRVVNLSSKQKLEGVVTPSGEVKVSI